MTGAPKVRALGNALRSAREDRGLSLRALAQQLHRNPGVLSRWENGVHAPKPDQVAQVLTTLGIDNDKYDEVIALAYGAYDQRWVATNLPDQRQQFAAFIDFEQKATSIVDVSPLLVPGILQTTEYIRAIMNGGGIPTEEISNRVVTRVGRREILERRELSKLVAVMGEGVLYQVIGDRNIMIEQLRHLLEMARHAKVDLRIVPYNSGWHPALEGPFMIIKSDKFSPVVMLENRKSGLLLHEEDDVRAYDLAANRLVQVSTSPSGSAEIINNVLKRMEKNP